MHDLSYFRKHFDRIAERLATRSNAPNLDRFRELDQHRRAAISRTEQLKAQRNLESAEIGKLRREGVDTTARQQQTRAIDEEIATLDKQVKTLEEEFGELLAGIPNVPHESVPTGPDETANVQVRCN